MGEDKRSFLYSKRESVLIKCPNCDTNYNVPNILLKNKRKFKCSFVCQNIWIIPSLIVESCIISNEENVVHNHTLSRSQATSKSHSRASQVGIKVKTLTSSTSRPNDGISIDMAKVDALLRETRKVEEILTPIYEDEVSSIPIPSITANVSEQSGRLVGLSAEQNRLFEILVTQAKWARTEFEAKAHELGLMPGGALEAINEWAYDTFDEELIEDGDPLIINMALLAEAPGASS
ncbi:hypothetical protein GOB93_16605 [Acetobacter musti]|uniref:TerB-C domain-containing protein n=1 Tax=Acetobacter musti TaxID=864732 RepID=A0ABX0JTV9_9PROT|nr:tellurite resistance TerB C-terminal domain-containing protein [Acetobacter musti]NHN86247.1 hypothetical protein [Acetobacter musti]